MNTLFNIEYFGIALNIVVFALVIGLVLRPVIKNKEHIVPYNIAVIGLPRSGKTTLITTMFSEIFYHHVLSRNFAPRGTETIDKVNENLQLIKMGKSLGPTPEQDVFAYRADLIRKKLFFSTRYRISIGDFAGEHSQSLSENSKIAWLHETTFFKWVMEADAYIFVIDVAASLSEDANNYRAKLESDFMSVWQHLAEYHLEGKKSIQYKKVALAFNKADIIFRADAAHSDSSLSESTRSPSTFVHVSEETRQDLIELSRLGFSDKIPPVIKINSQDMIYAQESLFNMFQNLINYFTLQSKSLRSLLVSSFAIIDDSRIGIRNLVEFILPSQSTYSSIYRLFQSKDQDSA
jgi:hypothetical protein